jgi:nuclear pore complex protein Nup160
MLIRSDTISSAWLHNSPVTARLRGSPAAMAQRYLQVTLGQHDSAHSHFNYRRAVSNVFFELNADKTSGWQMPAWLVEWEMERDAEGWIACALRYGWVEEAVDWAAELLRRVSTRLAGSND